MLFQEHLWQDNPETGRILDAIWDSPSGNWSSSDPFAG
jgi:hypothetical protein